MSRGTVLCTQLLVCLVGRWESCRGHNLTSTNTSPCKIRDNIGRGSNPIGVTMPTSPFTHLLEAHTNLAAALIAAR